MQIGGAAMSAIAGARAYRRQMNNLRKQERENQNWYDRRYNENATERADSVALNEQAKQHFAERMAQHQGTAAVMGGTNAQLAAEKNAEAAGYANIQAQRQQMADTRKDTIENKFMTNKSNIQNQMLAMEQQRAQGIQQAASQMAQAGSDLMKLPK
jgi:hypothetical protein